MLHICPLSNNNRIPPLFQAYTTSHGNQFSTSSISLQQILVSNSLVYNFEMLFWIKSTLILVEVVVEPVETTIKKANKGGGFDASTSSATTGSTTGSADTELVEVSTGFEG